MPATIRASFGGFPGAVNVEVAVTYLGEDLGNVVTLPGDALYHDFYAENAPPIDGYAATAKANYSGQPCTLGILGDEGGGSSGGGG